MAKDKDKEKRMARAAASKKSRLAKRNKLKRTATTAGVRVYVAYGDPMVMNEVPAAIVSAMAGFLGQLVERKR